MSPATKGLKRARTEGVFLFSLQSNRSPSRKKYGCFHSKDALTDCLSAEEDEIRCEHGTGLKRKRDNNPDRIGLEAKETMIREPESPNAARRLNNSTVQEQLEMDILARNFNRSGTYYSYDCNLYYSSIILRFNNFSSSDNSLKRILVVVPQQPQVNQ